MDKKRIVVFGATGKIGAYLSLHLVEEGYDVVAVGHRKSDNGFFADYNIPYFSVDVANKKDFEQLPTENIYAVMHFAGALPGSMEGYDAELYINSIMIGTLNVLEYTRKVGADRIVFPETLFDIHYLFGSKVPIPADAEKRVPEGGDHVMYVIAKMAACEMIEDYYRKYGIKRFIFRLSRIYLYTPTPYTFTDGKKEMIVDRWLIYQAMKGADLEIWGDPYKLLETISINDFLRIMDCALKAEHDGGFYNIGSGGSTNEERIKAIAEVFNPEDKKSRIIYRPEKRSANQFVLDIRKTVNELGYEPKDTFKDFLLFFKKEMELQRFHKLWGYEKDFYTNE